MPIDVTKLKVVPIMGFARGGGYALVLNPMTGPAEGKEAFGPFDDVAAALKFHDAELSETRYTEERDGKTYHKSFKKGSDLEWMNPLMHHQREMPDKVTGLGIWEISFQPIDWKPVE